MNADELFDALEVRSLSPKLRWMQQEGIITYYHAPGHVEPTWFAGFQKWWPALSGADFFCTETSSHGDSRIGEGESEAEALANLMTCGEARQRNLKLWFEQDAAS